MKKHLLLFSAVFFFGITSYGSVGDTTWVKVTQLDSFTHPGTFDFHIGFPNGTVQYRKIYMIYTLGEYNCSAGTQYCHQWDYDVENYIMVPGGDTLELARFITPYATGGTPGFGATWKQPYIFDVTDFYPLLKDSAGLRVNYSGYSYGFTFAISFAFIEGTPERNVLGLTPLWNSTYTYGNLASVIDSSVLPIKITPPAGTQSAEMKVIITGHGSDGATGCCEFDNTGQGHTYSVLANNNTVAQTNMNTNCGASEIYPQGGTWAYGRAGNWCPGGLVSTGQYPLTGLTAGNPATTDINFDDTYNGVSGYGIYKIASEALYYGAYNKVVDASLEDIIAPTNFAWYIRENPRVSVPVIKVRNTGSTPINSILFQYGVKDSTLAQYIWTGYLSPSNEVIINLPALKELTNLSVDSALGIYTFVAEIALVNGQVDNDQSNDTLTSFFKIAPKWPAKFSVNLLSSSFGANGSFTDSLSDASWQITDEHNNVVASRTNAKVVTTYKDTVDLPAEGFYALSVSTTNCFGLSWWVFELAPPNNTPGYVQGSVYVWDVNRHIKIPVNGNTYAGGYHDDFGCGFTQYFTTKGECQADEPLISKSGDTLIASQGVSYQWYKNGNPIGGATGQTYVLGTGGGNYIVAVTNNSGCTGTSQSFAVLNVGIRNLADFANVVSIFPNPAADLFNLVVSTELTGTSYAVHDITGRLLLSGKIENESNAISVRGFAPGVYLVSIYDGSSCITKHLVIQK